MNAFAGASESMRMLVIGLWLISCPVLAQVAGYSNGKLAKYGSEQAIFAGTQRYEIDPKFGLSYENKNRADIEAARKILSGNSDFQQWQMQGRLPPGYNQYPSPVGVPDNYQFPLIPKDLQVIRYPKGPISNKEEEGRCQKAIDDLLAKGFDSSSFVSSYLEACTKTTLLQPGFADFEYFVGALGVEEKGSVKYFCSATLLSNQKILTARHCFFDDFGGSNEMLQALRRNKVIFASNKEKFQVGCEKVGSVWPSLSCGIQDVGPYQLNKDYLLLAAKPNNPYIKPARRTTDIKVGDHLMMYSTFDSTGQLRYTSVSGCTVKKVAGQCIKHDCCTQRFVAKIVSDKP